MTTEQTHKLKILIRQSFGIVIYALEQLADVAENFVDVFLTSKLDAGTPRQIEQRSQPDGGLLNVAEAAELLSVSEKFIRDKAKANKIPFSKTGNRYKFDKQKLLDWTAQNADKPEKYAKKRLHVVK